MTGKGLVEIVTSRIIVRTFHSLSKTNYFFLFILYFYGDTLQFVSWINISICIINVQCLTFAWIKNLDNKHYLYKTLYLY